ncbi:hypothetical protein N9094_01595 [bacterium]|nr:hypothetical protein [bacterium]MDC0312465.1 hypothetical protein [Verrucomicrobiales bacterium]
MPGGAAVTYEVTATDLDNDPLTFEWTLSNGDFFVTAEPMLTYAWPAGGDYTMTVLADALEPFHRVSSDPTGTTVTDLRDIKMVGNAALAVGSGGLILRSADHGVTWSSVLQEVTTDLLLRVSYGGGKIVIAHWTGTLISTDGLNWVDGNAPELGWNHVQWVKDRFINTGWRRSEGLWTSSDGESWERPIVVPQQSYEMPIIVGVGNLFYAMGDYSQGPNQVAISVDGVRWFAREAPRGWSRRTGGLIYGGTIVTVGNDGQIRSSSGLSPQETQVVTFRNSQESHPLEGLNGPNDDPDGDGWPNLVEFALWMKADESDLLAEDGQTPNRGVCLFYNEETGKVELEHLNPQAVERLKYQLRYTLDFDTRQEVELTPEVVVLGNGSSRVCYRDLD